MATVASALPRETLPRRVWIMLFVAGACLALFFATVFWVFGGADAVTPGAARFDRSISLALAQFREHGPTGRMMEVSALGAPAGVMALAIVMGWTLFKAKDWPGLSHLVTGLLSASVLARLLQYVWTRPRPETLLSYLTVTQGSFPSAHLFGAAACYMTLAFLWARLARDRATEVFAHVSAALLVVLIGLSRVYLGAHHTTDVLAGMAGGWAWGLVVAAGFSLAYRDRPASGPLRR